MKLCFVGLKVFKNSVPDNLVTPMFKVDTTDAAFYIRNATEEQLVNQTHRF